MDNDKQMPVVITGNDANKEDHFIIGHIPANKGRLLYGLCETQFDWCCGYDDMHPDKSDGQFQAYANDIEDVCRFAMELPRMIAKVNSAETFDCLFSIGFSIQGCPADGGEGLDSDDFNRAITKRCRDITLNREWPEAVECLESVAEVRGESGAVYGRDGSL